MRPLVIAVSAVVLLAGCTATAKPTPSVDAHAAPVSSPTPTPSVSVPPIGTDAMLVIHATVSEPGGAQLQIQYQVHQTRPWDNLANSAVPKIFESDCPDDFDDQTVALQQWSFTIANVAATSDGIAWPSPAHIAVMPSGRNGWVVARGVIQNGDPSAKKCQGDKFFDAEGVGGVALGLKGDGAPGATDTVTGSNGWTALAWGIKVDAASGMSISNCQIQTTAVGRQYGTDTGSWSTKSDATACEAGAASALG